MRIAVLPPRSESTDCAVDNYYVLHALRELLPEHTLTVWNEDTSVDQDLYLTVGARFLEDGFWDRRILGKPSRVAALALSLPSDWKWDERTTEKMGVVGKSGGVSVVDETTLKKCKEILVASALSLGGSPALFLNESPMELAETAVIFEPSVSDPAFSKHPRTLRRLLRRFYQRINHKGRALFVVQSRAEFEWGGMVGSNTLFEPNHPQLHLKALASASGVVTFHPTTLMAAVACGVPAVLVGNDPQATAAAECAGIPFLQINPNTDPAELDHRAEEILRKYPWETVREKTQRLKSKLLEHLKELKLAPKEARRRNGPKAVASTGSVVHMGSILSREDIASFTGLFENLLACADREVHHHVLALDRATEVFIQKTFVSRHVYVYRVQDLWDSPDLTPLLSGPACKRFLIKPRFLLMLARKTDGPIFYCDPGTYFYREPSDLVGFMDGGHTLFFPHWTDSLPEAEGQPLFDTSVLLISPASEALLQWWARTAVLAVSQSASNALPDEPVFLGMAPVLFPGVRVYRAADQNAVYSCARSLGLHSAAWPGEAARLADERAIGSLRWQRQLPDPLFAVKVVWDQLAYFFADLPVLGSHHALIRAVRHQQRGYWRDLDLFLNAHAVFCRHFPWVPSDPSAWSLRFFVCRAGRWPLRWLSEAAYRLSPPRFQEAEHTGLERAWSVDLQKRIFAPFRPAAASTSVETPNRAAVSA